MRFSLVILFSSIFFLLIGVVIFSNQNKLISNSKSNDLISLNTGVYPWGQDINTLKDRLIASNLEALSQEGNVLHTHEHLDLYINGKHEEIPAKIGINEKDGYISPVHTHDTTGIIHVESPTIRDFTLGDFFNVWGVRFNDQCLGKYCSLGSNKVLVYVNGKLINKNFRDIRLQAHQEIAIIYGSEKEITNPIPSGYSFPPNY